MLVFREKDMIDGNDSKGMNLRFKKGDYFYKTERSNTDENNIEEFVSNFLSCTTLKEEVDYIKYSVIIGNIEVPSKGYSYKNIRLSKSKSFISEDETLITIDYLFRQKGVNIENFEYDLPYDRKINIFLDEILKITNINLEEYFSKCFLIDVLILNRDRHTANLGVILNKNREYRPAPIFDNGLSFNTGTLPSERTSKPFYQNYKERIAFSQRICNYSLEIYEDKFIDFESKITKGTNNLNKKYLKMLKDNIQTYSKYITWVKQETNSERNEIKW